jgi:hypothetical protein
VLASEPNDHELERLFYVTVFNTAEEHPLKALMLKKCKWHYEEHSEGSESYRDFQNTVKYTATEYGLD